MNIKPLHIVILISILAGIIIYLYMKMNRLEIDLAILKKKYENIKHLEEEKKILNKTKEIDTISDSSTVIIKSEKKSTQKKESPKNDIFKSLGIPNIFEIFSSNNMVNLKNMDKFTSHPSFENLVSSATEDIDTSTVSIKRENSPKIISSNIEIKKDILEQNNKIIDNQNINSVIHTENISKVINDVNKHEEEIDKTEYDNNENIETYSNSDNKSEKSNLEKLKLNELKDIAKKKNINLFNGKKPKNKTELINDILKS
jgi:hypothetical protein